MNAISGFADLASIHTQPQQDAAKTACGMLTNEDMEGGLPHSCWIGMRRAERNVDEGVKERFSWSDGSAVDYGVELPLFLSPPSHVSSPVVCCSAGHNTCQGNCELISVV